MKKPPRIEAAFFTSSQQDSIIPAAAVVVTAIVIAVISARVMPVAMGMAMLGAMTPVIGFTHNHRRVVIRRCDDMARAALVIRVEAVEWCAAGGDGNARLGYDSAAWGVVTIAVTVAVTVTVT